MKKKVLVYDNQLGYYELLKDAVSNSYDFLLFSKRLNHKEKYDAVAFFLHDDLELLDIANVYEPAVPFILGTSKRGNGYIKSNDTNSVFTVDISQTKDEIVNNLQIIFSEISQLSEKEEAL